MNRSVVLCVTLFSLLLTGCLEYHEQMQLAPDGSGEVTMSVGMDNSILNLSGNDTVDGLNESEIRDHFADIEGLEITGSTMYNDRGLHWVEISLRFTSPEVLEQAVRDGEFPGFFGRISYKLSSDGTYRFSRTVAFDEGDLEDEEFGRKLLQAMFSRYFWEYEITFPGEVLKAKAPAENIDPETHTVRWSYSLGELAGSARTMTATITGKSGVSPWVLVGVGGVIGLGLLVALLLRL